MATSEPDAAAVEPASLVRNSAWSTASTVLSHGIIAIVSVVAVRSVTVDAWGRYSTAVALLAIFSMFSESGVSTVALREMSREPARAPVVLGASLRAVWLLAALAAPLLFVAAAVLGYPDEVVVLLAIGLPSLLLYPALGLLRSAFNARRVMVYVAQFNVLNAVVYATVALGLLAAGAGTHGLMVATIAGYLASATLGTILLARRLGVRPQLRVPGGAGRAMVRAAFALAGIWVVNVVYDRIDVLMLSKLDGSDAVAQYSIAYTGIRLTWLVPSLVAGAFFPLLSRLLEERPDEARDSFFLLVRVFIVVGVPMAAFLAFGGRELVPFVFGASYQDAGDVLAILAWSTVLTFQNYVLWYGVLACHRERAVLWIQLAGLGVNVLANALLIPRWGISGAAVALLISELWAVGGQLVVVHRSLFAVPLRRILVAPLIAGLLFAPLAVLAGSWALVAAVASIVLYPAALQALGYVSAEEWRPLTGPLAALWARLGPRRA